MELGVQQNKFLRQFWTVVGAHLTVESSALKLSSLSVNVTLNWFRCVQLTAQNHRQPNIGMHSAKRQRSISGILFISGQIFGGRLAHWDERWLFQLQWLISKLQESFCLLPLSAEIADLYCHTQLLTWMLNLWTQVLLFAHWAPYCLKTHFSSTKFHKMKKWPLSLSTYFFQGRYTKIYEWPTGYEKQHINHQEMSSPNYNGVLSHSS